MQLIPEIESFRDDLIEWRHDIHAHPELAYQEERTSGLVASLLESWGVTVHRGLARTGVVGSLSGGDGPRIGLRADMDALAMDESNTFEYRSRNPGRMHACGHDGHTTMLLGAARYLAERDLAGTVHFIFQPAEEAAGGARLMVEEGLFEQFPVDAVFGMHNWPGLSAGRFAMRTGPMMASFDRFDIVIEGRGAHAAAPHTGVDPVMVSAQIVTALQSIVSRNVDPQQPAVISVTKMSAGDAYNVIPEIVTLNGGIRCFDPQVRELLRRRIVEVSEGLAQSLGARATADFIAECPAVINAKECTALASRTTAAIVGDENVDTNADPVMVSEDFAYMLGAKPGCYILIGNGAREGGCMIHNPNYDFNDDVLALGATYWASLTENFLREKNFHD